MIDYLVQAWSMALNGKTQGVFFFFSLYTACVALYSLMMQIRMASWPAVEGELLECGLRYFGPMQWPKSDRDYVANALYRYRVDGQDYTGGRVSVWAMVASHNLRFIIQWQLKFIRRHADGRVSVFYNPKRPHKSILIKPGKISLGITFVVAVLPMILYFLKYYT